MHFEMVRALQCTLRKETLLVHCLHKLHNYWFNENEPKHCKNITIDSFYSSITWWKPFVNYVNERLTLEETLDGGDRSDNNNRWRARTSSSPYDRVLWIIGKKNLHRTVSNSKWLHNLNCAIPKACAYKKYARTAHNKHKQSL